MSAYSHKQTLKLPNEPILPPPLHEDEPAVLRVSLADALELRIPGDRPHIVRGILLQILACVPHSWTLSISASGELDERFIENCRLWTLTGEFGCPPRTAARQGLAPMA